MSLNAHKNPLPVTGVILAGGQSRRMGQNKALMQLGNDTVIGHVLRGMRKVTDELLLVTNSPTEYAHLGVPMHGDILPDTGALGGIYTGLTYGSYDAALCVGCDNPFLVPNLLNYLVSVLGEYDAVMPYTDSRRQPSSRRKKNTEVPNPSHNTTQGTLQTLCAAYAKRCVPLIEGMLRESELRVHALQERAHIKRISPDSWRKFDPEGTSFFNINTPEDFERADSYMRSQTTD